MFRLPSIGSGVCNFCCKWHQGTVLSRLFSTSKRNEFDYGSGIDEDHQYFFSRVLDSLPADRSTAFAYGSGVFRQAGDSWDRKSMLDFIIATDNPLQWHKENLEINRSHYPISMRLLGPKVISQLQTEFGAKIYFNTLVPFEDGLIKYGVISTNDLVADLLDWDTLYVAGRLHKPVRILELSSKSNADVLTGLRANLFAVLNAALIELPNRCSEEDLYMYAAGLSYSGDLRMVVGEDKKKVENIVKAQFPLFRKLYAERLKIFGDYAQMRNGVLEHEVSEDARYYHLTQLPMCLQQKFLEEWNKDGRERDIKEVLYQAARDPYLCIQALRKGIFQIVRRSSTTQALKGVLTAGPRKAVRYSGAKLKKMFISMRSS